MTDDRTTGTQRPLQVHTEDAAPLIALTIAWHTDAARVGQRFVLGRAPVGVSRSGPAFRAIGRPAGGSLADRFVSRRPFVVTPDGRGGVTLDPADTGTEVVVDGVPLVERRSISPGDLRRGLVLVLAYRIVLVLHTHRAVAPSSSGHQLVGESAGIATVRAAIDRVADLDVPVLLRGESGTGKELVAEAIHRASGRSGGPYIAVNMGAIPPSTAASELFGHARGAFTGAGTAHGGYFAAAQGGTLFLDEVGDTPEDVQVMLLRVLQTGEVQPVGRATPRRVDVRLVAATDSRIEHMLAEGRLREPFYHRLSGYELTLPPLRERRDDIGRLWLHFLREELAATGDLDRLVRRSEGASPWLAAATVARIVAFDWPGNIRQLRNAARQLAVASRGQDHAVVDERLTRLLGDVPSFGRLGDAVPKTRPGDIGDEQLVEALRRNQWRVGATARDLGVARSSLYVLIDRCPLIRKAADLTAGEIRAASADCGGNLDLMAAGLEVSKRGLQLRMRELGRS